MNTAYISYQITPVSLSEHLFEVRMQVQLDDAVMSLDLTLPAWIPGSYMIRDFARNIIQIDTVNNQHCIKKLDKQTWTLSHRQAQAIDKCQLVYRVFAFDLSVRSAFINHEYAFFNGTSVFLKVIGLELAPHYLQTLHTEQTQTWQTISAMPKVQLSTIPPLDNVSADSTVYRSDCYHTLIDHPVLMGALTHSRFSVDGIIFHLVFTGAETMDLQRICDDLTPICRHHISLFGECPVQEYWFMTLLCATGMGGLEHKSSTVLQFSRFDLPMRNEVERKNEGYQQFLSLCSHEFLHTWHVKRTRPKVLLAPELSQEVYTPQLWIYEGFTSFYDDLALARTGLISALDYCQLLGQSITRMLRNPGRHLQSIAQSSFDAWTRFYKQDANSVNHIVSYYLKGSIVALALDITIRQQSQNKYSLDDIMRQLWLQFGKDEIGTPDDVIEHLCKSQYGIDLHSFLHIAVDSTMDLPLSSMVNSIGLKLHMRARESNTDLGGLPAKHPQTRDVGASFTEDALGLKLSQVLTGSAATFKMLKICFKHVASDDHIVQL